jgi:hypothetical protein
MAVLLLFSVANSPRCVPLACRAHPGLIPSVFRAPASLYHLQILDKLLSPTSSTQALGLGAEDLRINITIYLLRHGLYPLLARALGSIVRRIYLIVSRFLIHSLIACRRERVAINSTYGSSPHPPSQNFWDVASRLVLRSIHFAYPTPLNPPSPPQSTSSSFFDPIFCQHTAPCCFCTVPVNFSTGFRSRSRGKSAPPRKHEHLCSSEIYHASFCVPRDPIAPFSGSDEYSSSRCPGA